MSVSDAQAEAAANVLAAFMDEPVAVVEAPAPGTVQASSPAVDDTADEPEVEAAAPSFEYSPEVPEDVLRELQEADIDEAVERELAARPAAVVEDDEFTEYGSGESEAEIRERIKLQKRNEYLEAELAKTKSVTWQQEALKYFPLSKHALGDIKASSRRGYLRAAKAEHEKILPYVQEVLAEAKGVVDEARTEAVTEGRAAAEAAFGKPLSGPDVGVIDQAAANADIEQARRTARESGSLVNLYRTMLKQGR